tara:strand:+ start:1663 stop:2340 length:678 start_codon:yes stop_codon:yes gene_type:complete
MAVVTPDLPDIFEEAYERAGIELNTGYDLRTARRSLNIMLLEWQNRGLNLFTIDEGTLPIAAGTATYTMPVDTIDVIEHNIRTGTGTNQVDTALERISVSNYAAQSNKNTTGKPSQIYVQRLAAETKVTLWPVPDTSYTLSFFRLKGIDGLSTGIGTTAAIPPRFIPCLVAGLAYQIAMKKPESSARVVPLKQEYEYQFELAAGEDAETASIRFVPHNTFLIGGG